jgi:lipid-binding SYLF domain-containing protein
VLRSEVKLGANASAAAGPIGRDAQAATDALVNADFLTYSRAKGLFAGLDLIGDVLVANGDDTMAEYGPAVHINSVLHGAVKTPPNAEHFVHTIAKYFVISKKWKMMTPPKNPS